MTEQNTVTPEQPATVEPESQVETPTVQPNPELENLKAENEKLRLMNEHTKKAQSGSDAAVEKLKKEMEQLRLSSMDEKSRIAFEKQLAEDEKEKLEKDREALTAQVKKFEYITDHSIDPKWATILQAGDESSLSSQVATIQSIIDEKVKPLELENAELKAMLGRPGGGAGVVTQDWKSASVSQKSAEYRRIENEQGKAAAQTWLNSIQ